MPQDVTRQESVPSLEHFAQVEDHLRGGVLHASEAVSVDRGLAAVGLVRLRAVDQVPFVIVRECRLEQIRDRSGWVRVDLETGQAIQIPLHIVNAYGEVTDGLLSQPHIHPHALLFHVHDHRHQVALELVDLGEILRSHLLLLPVVQCQRDHGVLNSVFRHHTDRSTRNVWHLRIPGRAATEESRHLLVDLVVLLHAAVFASEEVEGVSGFVLRDQRGTGHRAVDSVKGDCHPSFPKEVEIEFKIVADPQIDTFLVDEVVEPLDNMRVGPYIPVPREPGERDGDAEQLVGPPFQPRGLGVYDHHRSVVNAWEFGH